VTIRSPSPSTRFSSAALLAIVVPATIVAVLGYVSLRQWEASAELLFREQARDMASMAAEKVEMILRHTDDAVLARLQRVLAGTDLRDGQLEALLAESPLIGRLYLFDRRGRRLYPSTWTGEDAELYRKILAEISEGFWERSGRRDFFAAEQAVLAAVLKSREGSPVLAALCRNLEVLRREVLDKTLRGLEAATIVAVLDQDDRPVYTRGSLAGAQPVASARLRDGLPSWRVALYEPRGRSPRASVRRQVAVFTGAFGVLLVVIVAGVALTWRLVRRETEMARLKSDFVANVSHDLKTPLSVIRMFGETLEMGRVTDETKRREYYRVITRESERLSRLIDNVLDFSRIEGGRRRYDFAPTAVEPLVRATLAAFAYPLTQQAFKVELDVAPDLPEVVMDADAVGQALANLVDNAIKYSGDEKWLTVEARVVQGELALAVVDRGIGIPAAEQARIFEKFYRVGRSETQGRRGSGVGLALVRHVADAHGGRVTVESHPGEGSRFTLWIPPRREASAR
jgi:signal transduction histidine kinase